MNELACPYCGSNLSDRAFFCGACDRQARCRECRELLQPEARICVVCGVATKGLNNSLSVINGASQLSPAVNKLDYEQTRISQSFHASLTDEAISNIGNSLAAFVTGRITEPISKARRISPDIMPVIEDQGVFVPGSSDLAEETPKQLQLMTALLASEVQADSDQEKLLQIFRHDGDRLRLDETRIKASHKADAVQRLTLLLLYAHEVEGRDSISRAELKAELEDTGLYDGNSRRWVANCPDLHVDDSSVRLRIPGRERAHEILGQVFDANVPNKWPLGSAPRKRSSKQGGASEGEAEDNAKPKSRKGSTLPKKVERWMKAWENLNQPVAPHSLLETLSPLDKGLFALWAIRLAANEDGKEVSRPLLARFLWEAFEVKIDERTLERALVDSGAKSKASRVRGVTFQILPSGMDHIKQMMDSIVARETMTSANTRTDD